MTGRPYSLTQQQHTQRERRDFVYHMRMQQKEYRNTSLLNEYRPPIESFSNDRDNHERNDQKP